MPKTKPIKKLHLSQNNKVVLLPEVMDFHLDDDDRLEKKIQKSIMDFLKTVHCSNFAKIQQGPMSKSGVSDLNGCYLGRSVVIEIKRKKGKPTPLQILYLNANIKAGGYSAIARSVADIKEILKVIGRENAKTERASVR